MRNADDQIKRCRASDPDPLVKYPAKGADIAFNLYGHRITAPVEVLPMMQFLSRLATNAPICRWIQIECFLGCIEYIPVKPRGTSETSSRDDESNVNGCEDDPESRLTIRKPA